MKQYHQREEGTSAVECRVDEPLPLAVPEHPLALPAKLMSSYASAWLIDYASAWLIDDVDRTAAADALTVLTRQKRRHLNIGKKTSSLPKRLRSG
jgi:hypothetical protein